MGISRSNIYYQLGGKQYYLSIMNKKKKHKADRTYVKGIAYICKKDGKKL